MASNNVADSARIMCDTHNDYPCDLPAVAVLTALYDGHRGYTCAIHRDAHLLTFANYEGEFTYRMLIS